MGTPTKQQNPQIPEAVVLTVSGETSQEQVQAPPLRNGSSKRHQEPVEMTLEEAMHQMQGNLSDLHSNVVKIVNTSNGTIESLKALQGQVNEIQSHSLDLRKKEDREFVARVADLTGDGEYASVLRNEKYEKDSFSMAGIKRMTKQPVTIGHALVGVAGVAVVVVVAQRAGWIDLSPIYPTGGMDATKLPKK